MNPPIKRLLAFTGSIAAGLLGTIVLASPAQAHHPIITGKSVCQADGTYKITWTVQNGNWSNPYMKITTVTPTPDAKVDGIAVNTWLDPDKSVTGVQIVPGTTKEAKLYVDAYWFRSRNSTNARVHDSRTGVVKTSDTCEPEPNPTATFENQCDGTTNVHLVNPTSTMKTFRIKGSNNGYLETVELNKGETDKSVPASAGAITVEVKNGNGTWTEVGKNPAWARPSTEECPPPTVFSWSNCDSFKIAVTNPAKAQATTAKVTYGDQAPVTKPVAPGTTENFEFTPTTATQAKVELTGWETQTMTYVKPAETDCETLPKTGSTTTTLIASGSGLAMLGGLAFFFARRRSVKLRKLAAS